jgi:hypothetical protein
MMEYLDEVQPGEKIGLTQGVKNFCLRNHGKGILVLITDLMDKSGYDAALRFLVAQQMDVYVVQVLSAAEVDPDVTGDLKLVDSEDQDVAEITVSGPLLNRYRNTLNAFVETAKAFCNRRGMNYLLARTDRPVEQLVTKLLRERGLVR